MGVFGKKDKNEEGKELQILISTTENIGRPYDVIGLVTAKVLKVNDPDPAHVAKELEKEAIAKGADAIVGFRYDVRINSVNWTDQVAYGTAVKLK